MTKTSCCQSITGRRCVYRLLASIIVIPVGLLISGVLIILDIYNEEWLSHVLMYCLGVFFICLIFWIDLCNCKKYFLAIAFPVSCGNSIDMWVFSGKSSKTLQKILFNLVSLVPDENEFTEAESNAYMFINVLKTRLENKITPTTTFECFIAGSIAERICFPNSLRKNHIQKSYVSLFLVSDFDVMFCSNSMEASFDGSTGIRIDPLLGPGGFTGFVQLISLETNNIVSSKKALDQVLCAVRGTNAANLSPFLHIYSSWDTTISKVAPAIKIEIPIKYEADITLCIKCREWPTRSDWPTRQRHWPSPEDVRRIVSLGCHLVPKPAPSDKQQTSWRFSFSLAEVELFKLVPKTARKCFLALKIILKHHLQPVYSHISSYHMKTILFNTLEKTPTDLWVDEKIEQCFFMLLLELYDALLHGRLRHHWFSDINFFDWDDKRANCILKAAFNALTKKVQRIGENPAPFIYDDGEWYLRPCCTRLRLYDFPGDSDVQQVLSVNEPVDDRTNQDALSSGQDAQTQSNPLSSTDHREPSQGSVQSVIVTIHSDEHCTIYDDHEECQPLIKTIA